MTYIEPLFIILFLIILYSSWYFIGSYFGRKVMRNISKTCLNKDLRIRLLSPSSVLLEYRREDDKKYFDEVYDYIGFYIEWLPFNNIFDFPIRYFVRRRPLGVLRIQIRKRLVRRIDLYFDKDHPDNIYIAESNLSLEDISEIIALIKSSNLDLRIFSLGERPSVAVTLYIDRECEEILKEIDYLIKKLILRFD